MVAARVVAFVPAWELDQKLCLKPLAGWPSLAYSLAAGTQAEQVDLVVLAALDEKVLALAGQSEQVVPLLVPPELTWGGDARAVVADFSTHITDTLGEIVVWLSPRVPVRPCGLVDRAIERLRKSPQAEALESISRLGGELGGLARLDPDGSLLPVEAGPAENLVFRTADIQAVRSRALVPGRSPGRVVPFPVDRAESLDLARPLGWERAEWLLRRAGPAAVRPGRGRRPLPEQVDLLVMDFDGVLTDNRVFVGDDGREEAAAYRSDSLGLSYLQQAGIRALVISMETNPVVAARCRKMKVPYLQGIDDKAAVLRDHLAKEGIDPARVVYLGNDVNDVPCFPIVGCAAVVADALPGALEAADLVLERPGGYGAVRELCDRLIERKRQAP